MGMWLPVYNEEWDVPLGQLTRTPSPQYDADMGTVTFKANNLSWLVGCYEVKLLTLNLPP